MCPEEDGGCGGGGGGVAGTGGPEAAAAVALDELRSWWEVPAIAHFCSLFRTAFRLPDFEIEHNLKTLDRSQCGVATQLFGMCSQAGAVDSSI
ncbi:hypothetical protein DUI87_19893 [Hirundo rustica rustica]|uniref:Uncharacterized protein n=1 Tax=Hirundo rustica rustica TaxID=333673 RepID=A0A3M0JU98_HIRRU|nr:hypothetical protein DUI87_19893 [Hirundo rustica rustica]